MSTCRNILVIAQDYCQSAEYPDAVRTIEHQDFDTVSILHDPDGRAGTLRPPLDVSFAPNQPYDPDLGESRR